MKSKSLLIIIAVMVFAIIAYSQVKPKIQVKKTVNKQKVVAKSVANLKSKFKDSRNGKIYKTVKIGNQTWMAENLAYKAINGCWAYNNDEDYAKIYGYLYTWETAKKVCPTGWHLPSDAEWTELTTYLGGVNFVGTKMKSTSGWNAYNGKTGNGTNTNGFAGLPGGNRDEKGVFSYIEINGYWWSSNETSKDYAWYRTLHANSSKVSRSVFNKRFGLSVRCLKDL